MLSETDPETDSPGLTCALCGLAFRRKYRTYKIRRTFCSAAHARAYQMQHEVACTPRDTSVPYDPQSDEMRYSWKPFRSVPRELYRPS